MAYRTPEQDERLTELYVERDRILDYANEHPSVDVSLALGEVDSEIEFLTAGIGEMAGSDEPQDVGTAVAVASGTADLSLNDMTVGEQIKWFRGIAPLEF